MSQITARLPDELVVSIDATAAQLHCTHAEVVRKAIEYYFEGFEDLSLALQALCDPEDAVLGWEVIKHDLFNQH